MAAKLTFYPLGNADSTLIQCNDGRLILKDYCDCKNKENDDDKRIDLYQELKETLAAKERKDIDVVAFSHADNDHVNGSEIFFWLEYATKYQSNDRTKIKELWVPACFILEPNLEGSALCIRQEARHRLKEGNGIRVFGNPGCLDSWLKDQGIKPEDRKHLFVHAGTLVPGFNSGELEIFVHSPFSYKMEDDDVDRNGNSLVFHLTFTHGKAITKLFLGGDAEYETWDGLIYKTEKKKSTERLEWDIFRISHHCSYTALSSEKGKSKTTPTPKISSLFNRGKSKGIIISSSDIIPSKDSDQPPHCQAKKYYEEVASNITGKFLVTMEHPKQDSPEPITITINENGHTWNKVVGIGTGIASIASSASPRLGSK